MWNDGGLGWEQYPEIKDALKPTFIDDGIFWMSKEEFFRYFTTVYLCAQNMEEFLKDSPDYDDVPDDGPDDDDSTLAPTVNNEDDVAEKAKLDDQLHSALEHPISFNANEATLNDAGLEVVHQIAAILISHPKIQICIDGHSSERLVEMSMNRAIAVKDKLEEMGCRNTFFAEGWGNAHPEVGSWKGVKVYSKKDPAAQVGDNTWVPDDADGGDDKKDRKAKKEKKKK